MPITTTTTTTTAPVHGLLPKIQTTTIVNGDANGYTQSDVASSTSTKTISTAANVAEELAHPASKPETVVPTAPAISVATASSSSASSSSGSVGRRTPSQTRRVATVQIVDPCARYMKKRIVICCDGTWEDGLMEPDKTIHTNILRLARAINHDDDRHGTVIPQIVYYQSGIGSTKNDVWTRYVAGATGLTLVDKVAEAYGFIAHNYHPGDEVFLFGFSRGAYTARMIATFIGEIGILDRRDMDYFAEIFVAYQKRGKEDDPEELKKLDKVLSKWNSPNARGKLRVDSEHTAFTVKCVGVFDTVGAIGLPKEICDPFQMGEKEKIFGFNDRLLGTHVERAYHALALDETRADFDCCKFEQTPEGRDKGQILKQCWFTGSHADIGGGWKEHDLSDITLAWMAAEIGDILSIDAEFLQSLPTPVTGWGELKPHSPLEGVYKFAQTIQRQIPTGFNEKTHEYVHSSVLQQKLLPALRETIKANGKLVAALLPLEDQIKCLWKWNEERAAKGEIASPVEVTSAVVQVSEDLGSKEEDEEKKEMTEEKESQQEKRNSSPLIKAVKELVSHTPSPPATPVPVAEATPPASVQANKKPESEKVQDAEKPKKLERNKSKRENKTDKAEKRSSRIIGAMKGLVNEVTSEDSRPE